MMRRRRDVPAARRQPPESGGWRRRPESGGWRQPPQSGGWRQPPETTAEPVPLRRPYIPPDAFPPRDQAPPPGTRFRPRRRPAAQGQAPGGTSGGGSIPPSPPSKRLPAMRRWRPMRAIIGDEFRTPMLWCEFGSCIARYTSEDALGERDLRAQALSTGWRYDALGRLACPSCTRHDPSFRGDRPPAPAGQYPPGR